MDAEPAAVEPAAEEPLGVEGMEEAPMDAAARSSSTIPSAPTPSGSAALALSRMWRKTLSLGEKMNHQAMDSASISTVHKYVEFNRIRSD